ncbi:MAG TPA: PEP-CTERM sorting domain-containing protein [Methylophilus sp.]|nr:PEP-CTERM sorting domain-containing protein [Methylophilus sp.]
MFQKLIFTIGLLATAAANAASSTNSPVPEPESISLMLFGVGLIGVIVFRQK